MQSGVHMRNLLVVTDPAKVADEIAAIKQNHAKCLGIHGDSANGCARRR
jgi:hypothetical protein